jgi:hypothetical protein
MVASLIPLALWMWFARRVQQAQEVVARTQ